MIENLTFSVDDLRKEVDAGYVSIRPHPEEKLFIFNYTAKAQYNQHWNEVTKNCRGLILDDDYKIVARPFGKIFNYSEVIPDKIIYDQAPIIHDKLDGSLTIAYPTSKGWQVSTRGSFESEQAIWATKWLNDNHPNYDQSRNITCLFEVIYPDNRICVDYGERAELVLIAAINNFNGADFPLQAVTWWNGSVVEQITGPTDIDEAYRHATSNEFEKREGVVCTWFKYNQPSYRLKIKHPEYIRLHKIIYSFSKGKVWEVLSNGEDYLSLIEDIPDEFYAIIKGTIFDLQSEFQEVDEQVCKDFDRIKHLTERKDFADAAKTMDYPSIMFRMLDGKDYDDIIWKVIKP